MKVVAPMPVQDAPVSKTTMGYTLSITWRKWLQTIADFAIAATRARTGATGARYVLSGAAVTISYTGAGGAPMALPVTPLGDAWLDVFDGTNWSKVKAIKQANDSFMILLPAGAEVHARGTYLGTLTE